MAKTGETRIGQGLTGSRGSGPMADTDGDKDRKQLTLRVPQDVHKKLRVLAALHEMTMTEYFIALVEEAYRKDTRPVGPVQLKLPT
jgi:hypothetical protein